MALNEERLTAKIKTVITECALEKSSAEVSKEKFAISLSKAIISELKTAIVTGVCPPSGGPLTNGKII
ncbi:hypothetical protein [Tenacibaculum salmonis]|uniref:hypothetical protein n=1 Tax=Tenacibaculum sp. P3-BQ1 TaxID=3232310 RepID=UPI0034DEB836